VAKSALGKSNPQAMHGKLLRSLRQSCSREISFLPRPLSQSVFTHASNQTSAPLPPDPPRFPHLAQYCRHRRKIRQKSWQETLQAAAVDSITLFSKCHHGWSYHPTSVGKIHPHLNFDLLRAQYDATKEAGINAPVYLSAGFDQMAADEQPGWRESDKDGRTVSREAGAFDAGYHLLDFHSPYLDYLCEQIREVAQIFPDCDGIFLDIISQNQSCGRWSLEFMKAHGLDPEKEEDRKESSRLAVEKYYTAIPQEGLAWSGKTGWC
jgi:hypothetical protein